MKITLLAHTPNPENHIAQCARVCYGSDKGGDIALVRHLRKSGHTSALEHASFTFKIEGVSRACVDQIARHRIASHSVRSQRYCTERDFAVVMPPSIADRIDAKAAFNALMYIIRDTYEGLANVGVPLEDARFILPMACESQMVSTFNAASLLHFFEVRCCNRAQWEVRAVANEMLRLVQAVAPGLFEEAGPRCEHDTCREAKPCKKEGSARFETSEKTRTQPENTGAEVETEVQNV